jgi:hypothetical protein
MTSDELQANISFIIFLPVLTIAGATKINLKNRESAFIIEKVRKT